MPTSAIGEACHVAQILNKAEIPNILWGFVAISLAGDIPNPDIPEIDLMIPDHQIADAVLALNASRSWYRLCEDTDCIELTGERSTRKLQGHWIPAALLDKWAHWTPALRPDIPAHRRTPRPRFQLAWDYLNGRRPLHHNPYVGLLRLREYLISSGGLPRELPRWDCSWCEGWDDIETSMA
ncbi:hypothetical protein BDW74DRAFT_183575 [Aspergillus multicolor]|uniref:uncharacterized protein n=1 Tax=Aspergillus multicolor TaxID=41759 RepID=UPI003CCE0F34